MRKNFFFLALLALIVVVFTQTSPVSAEFSASTQELAAQSRPRITIHPRRIHPGPNSKRYCRSWLAKEYRVSGPVIMPHMHCWWY